jgi:hypothetical protein
MVNIASSYGFAPPPDLSQCTRCHQQYHPRSWHQKYCQACQKIKAKEWTESAIAKRPEYYRVKNREDARRHRMAVRLRALGNYSNQTFACACCAESERDFFTIDHIKGNASSQSKALGIPRSSYRLYEWLIRNQFPAGYQVLCMKCNMAKGHYGICPHKKNAENKLHSSN